MKSPRRYEFIVDWEPVHPMPVERETAGGQWVLYEDYAELLRAHRDLIEGLSDPHNGPIYDRIVARAEAELPEAEELR